MKGARVLIFASMLILAGCGNTPEDRGITGAGLGAAGGAILGAVTGLSVLEGALIGTGVGGVTGLLTDKDDIDIGDPIWETWFGSKREQTSKTTWSDPHSSSSLVSETQMGLGQLGYDPGPVDGVLGPKTRAAIREYQSDHGLAVTGAPTGKLAQHLRNQTAGSAN